MFVAANRGLSRKEGAYLTAAARGARLLALVGPQLKRGRQMTDTAIWTFRQLAHHELDGFGGIGEGTSIQIAEDARRILWLSPPRAPQNIPPVRVSQPR